ncbi:MAG: formylglycine-generating enzyme family protein [Flavobacteriaceae bacterium]|nr:formylglycine-generating enzyme family protein [Flavobacteriaceae bacterium]
MNFLSTISQKIKHNKLFFLSFSILCLSCQERQKEFTIIEKDNMIWIPSGSYTRGSVHSMARADEKPIHEVTISGFWMNKTEVTNAQFKEFVDATGYITTAERAPDWEELKQSLPERTPKPHDSLFQPASLTFKPTQSPVDLNQFNQWWHWTPQASWRKPSGAGSSIEDKMNHPVVHISWYDANAYAKWVGKRLPTEAEWEWAAKGGTQDDLYPWGNDSVDRGEPKTNSWDGQFPYLNTQRDMFFFTAPVMSYQPNGYGLYDMAGNVWEWCIDWYAYDYYSKLSKQNAVNPQGPEISYDPTMPYVQQRVLRGGSFLCNDTYCSGYRVSARMKSSPDTGLQHTGFRLVKDADESNH